MVVSGIQCTGGEPMAVGLVGARKVGSRIAQALRDAESEVVLHELVDERAAALAQAVGERALDSVAEVGEVADVVLLSLPDPDAMRTCLAELLRAVDLPQAAVDLSTVDISTNSHFRAQLKSIGNGIQQQLGTKFFLIDAVIGHGSETVGVHAGRADDVEQACWPLAQRRADVELDVEPADVLVFGLPRDFHYGPGMGSNPILMGQAIAAVTARASGAFREGGNVTTVSKCDGWFNEPWFPSYEETYHRYQRVVSVAEMQSDVAELCADRAFIDAYRNRHVYHPFHAISMLSFAEIARKRCSRIFVPGTEATGYARGMGLEPTRSVEEALGAARRYLGAGARMLALPNFLSASPTHLHATRSSSA